tara:strand:+ start:165 stop:1343 length:1179 start_codon:yes stop_codon:yes gene_type:complete
VEYNKDKLDKISISISENENSARSIFGYFMKLSATKEKTADNVNFFGQVNYFESDSSMLDSKYIEFAKNKNCKNIFSILPTECKSLFTDRMLLDYYKRDGNEYLEGRNLDSTLNELDSNLYFVFGSHEPELYTNFFKNTKPTRIKILFWPTYLITHTFYLYYSGLVDNPKSKYKNLDLVNKFEKLYINYNNRPRIHRKIMMDVLCKENLLNDGFNSWNVYSNNHNGTDIITSTNYKTECWEEKIMNLDDYKSKNKNYLEEHSHTLLYPNALFSLVGETSMDIPYVTEKTYRCFFFKQPFIAYGAKRQNKEILKYGFKIFDNIIDYSFDDEPDNLKRFELLVNELKKFKNKDYNEIYNQIEPILEHNRNRVYELLLNDEFIPKELLKVYENRN